MPTNMIMLYDVCDHFTVSHWWSRLKSFISLANVWSGGMRAWKETVFLRTRCLSSQHIALRMLSDSCSPHHLVSNILSTWQYNVTKFVNKKWGCGVRIWVLSFSLYGVAILRDGFLKHKKKFKNPKPCFELLVDVWGQQLLDIWFWSLVMLSTTQSATLCALQFNMSAI